MIGRTSPLRWAWIVGALALVSAAVALAFTGSARGASSCKVTLKIGGAGGAGLTTGDRVTMTASVKGCTVPAGAHFLVLRLGVNSLGDHTGTGSRSTCAIPCRIHDRRTTSGGYDYQVVLVLHGREVARSKVVRVVWATGGGGSGGGGSGTGTGGTGGGTTGATGTGGTGGSGSGTLKFTLDPSQTKVTNAQGTKLTISGMSADFATDPTTGAQYKMHYTWNVPSTLIPGVASSISISDTVSNVSPEQPISDAINALAPNFAQQLIAQYPQTPTVSMTYPYTLAGDTVQGFTITIGFQGSSVEYHYVPSH
ncbi:MAG: hypothetical protein ACYDHH_25255 [Solirubrobacteraceae bacterium]